MKLHSEELYHVSIISHVNAKTDVSIRIFVPCSSINMFNKLRCIPTVEWPSLGSISKLHLHPLLFWECSGSSSILPNILAIRLKRGIPKIEIYTFIDTIRCVVISRCPIKLDFLRSSHSFSALHKSRCCGISGGRFSKNRGAFSVQTICAKTYSTTVMEVP